MKNADRILTFVLILITWVSTAQTVQSQKLYKKDLKYFFELEGEAVKISEKEFKLLMADNEEALAIYNKSRKLSSLGSVGISLSIPLVLGGLFMIGEDRNTSVGSSATRNRGIIFVSTGLMCFVSFVVNKTLSIKQLEESLTIYNGSKGFTQQNQKWNVKWQFHSTGLGLVCSF